MAVVEQLLWRVAMVFAVLLLFAPMSARTSWSLDHGSMTHSAGWDWVAPLSGIIAILALAIGQRLRPGVIGPSLCAAFAALSFLAAAAAAFGHWLDLRYGALDIGGATTHPAPAVGTFAGIAAVGMVVALVLLGGWLHPSSR